MSLPRFFARVEVGVKRATCESVLSTKEKARKKKKKERCRKKRQMRGAVGGLGQEQARRFMAH